MPQYLRAIKTRSFPYSSLHWSSVRLCKTSRPIGLWVRRLLMIIRHGRIDSYDLRSAISSALNTSDQLLLFAATSLAVSRKNLVRRPKAPSSSVLTIRGQNVRQIRTSYRIGDNLVTGWNKRGDVSVACGKTRDCHLGDFIDRCMHSDLEARRTRGSTRSTSENQKGCPLVQAPR